jgi:hypothetical protein
MGRALSNAMTVFGLVLLPVIAAFAQATADDSSKLLEKHVHFLESQLDAKSEQVRANALDALATYDAAPQMERLQAAIHSSSETLQGVGLNHIRGHADADILSAVKTLIVEKEPKTNNDGSVGDHLFIELGGLEVLLYSSDADLRTFAIERIRSTLQAMDLPLIRWGLLVDLAGRSELRQLVPAIQKTATTEEKKLMALPALAKLGDADAAEQLRKAIISPKTSVQMWWSLAKDRDAMKAAQIEAKLVRTAINEHTFEQSIDKDLLLAYYGDTDGLLKRIRSYVRNDVPRNHDEETEIIRVLLSVGDVGDEHFLAVLDDLFDKLSDDLRRIDCSKAILQICARHRASTDQERKLDK